jgi:hypothetical protein
VTGILDDGCNTDASRQAQEDDPMKTRTSARHNHHHPSSERDLLAQFGRQAAEVETLRLEALADWASRVTADSGAADAVGSAAASAFVHA